MTLYSPVASLPYPALSDPPNAQTFGQNLTTALDSVVVPRFASAAAVTAAITAPVNGQVIMRTDIGTGCLMKYNSTAGGWIPAADCMLADVLYAADAGSCTISGIPNAFKELELTISGSGSDSANHGTYIWFNGDTGANYDYELMQVNGTTVAQLGANGATSIQVGQTIGSGYAAAAQGLNKVRIARYSETSYYTTVEFGGYSGDSTVGNQFGDFGGGIYKQTAAITSVTVSPGVGNWQTGSRFRLIGKV